MQLQHPRRKTWKEAENFLLNVWKWWKISIVFQKGFFQNDFIDTKNAVSTGRKKTFLLNYWKWSEKKSTKDAKTFRKNFLQKVTKER